MQPIELTMVFKPRSPVYGSRLEQTAAKTSAGRQLTNGFEFGLPNFLAEQFETIAKLEQERV